MMVLDSGLLFLGHPVYARAAAKNDDFHCEPM